MVCNSHHLRLVCLGENGDSSQYCAFWQHFSLKFILYHIIQYNSLKHKHAYIFTYLKTHLYRPLQAYRHVAILTHVTYIVYKYLVIKWQISVDKGKISRSWLFQLISIFENHLENIAYLEKIFSNDISNMVLCLKCVKNFYENITIVLIKKTERSHFKCR